MKCSILRKRILELQTWVCIIGVAIFSQAVFAQENGYWDERFSVDPSRWNSDNVNFIKAIAVTDSGDIYASGLQLIGYIIKWNGKGWTSFGGGNGGINAFATVRNDIYVGGGFTKIDTIQANRIAKYNLITKSWSALEADGFNGINHYQVYALAIYENNLYVGGGFTTAGAVSANNIAQWNISTKTWTSLGTGINGMVNAIVVKDGEVYAGGGFSVAGGVAANNIAKWNGHEWLPLGSGTNGQVAALTVCGDDIYVGGLFKQAGGITVNYIAKWNTVNKVWSSLSGGVSSPVYALASDGRVVYAGGGFVYADEMQAGSIVKWNPAKSCWSRVGGDRRGDGGGVDGKVNAILSRGNDLYLGGEFRSAGGKPSHLFASWHGPASPKPHAPAWANVPDVTIAEDDSAQIELYQYVTDTEHDLRGGLNFSARVIHQHAGANSNGLQVRLEKVVMGPSGRYVFANFKSANNANGIYKVLFTVTDVCGNSASDTIRVTVTPINDPPVIGTLPEITFNEDDSLLFPISNWFDYVSDVENADSGLFFRIFSSEEVKAIRRDTSFLFMAAPNWYGTRKLKVRVKDRRQLADSTWLIVNVKSVNDPPVIQGLPDSLSFQNNSAAELNLWEFAHDLETPDSLLQCTFAASQNGLNVQFDPKTGRLKLSAPNFSGKSRLFITIKDWKHLAVRDSIAIHVTSASLAKSSEQLPTEFTLFQNYPNPFNPTTLIRFGLPQAANVQLAIYNLAGHRVATLLNERKPAGYHPVEFDGRELASGTYFYRLVADQFSAQRKLLLIK